MTALGAIRREISGTARSIAYDVRLRLRRWLGIADDAYPEYAAYTRRPRRALRIGGIAGLAAVGVAGTYLALAGGLGGWLLGSNVTPPGTSGAGLPAGAHPAPSRTGSPTRPAKAPTPGAVDPHVAGGGRGPTGAPTSRRATSVPDTPPATASGTPTTSPSPSMSPAPTPTDSPTSADPSPSASPSPTDSAGTTVAPAAVERPGGSRRSFSTISTAGA
jgi:hypothetical protein